MTTYLMESAPGARTLISGRWRDYFSGTGYLGLQGCPDLIAAAADALQRYGLTSGTSRGGYGEHVVFHSVETAGAAFLGEERSLYTVSAYLGSGILLQGLRGEYEQGLPRRVSPFQRPRGGGREWGAGPPIPSLRPGVARRDTSPDPRTGRASTRPDRWRLPDLRRDRAANCLPARPRRFRRLDPLHRRCPCNRRHRDSRSRVAGISR